MKKSQSSDYMTRLEKTLAIDEDGNATFAKDVQADGAIGSNSGPKIIYTYEFDNRGQIYILDIFTEVENGDNYNFIGKFNGAIAIGSYSYMNDEIEEYTIYSVPTPQEKSIVVDTKSGDDFNHVKLTTDLENQEKQNSLYIHTLTLIAADKSYTLLYQAANDLKVNSIAGLRTITNVKTTADNVILPVCLTDLTGTAALQITTTLCKVGTANVTAVSDIVTVL